MEESRINEVIRTSLEKIRELSSNETIIGEPIKTDSGVTIIPVSKLSVGFVSGGVDFGTKKNEEKLEKSNTSFGGGGGTGLTVTPVGFLIVKANGDIEMLNVTSPTVVKNSSTFAAVGELIEKSPDIIKRLKEVLAKDKPPVEEQFTEDDE